MTWLDVLRSTPQLSEDDVKRYESKPLLILVEACVLDCLGQLDPGRSSLAREMVTRTFGGPELPAWRTAVRARLDLPEGLDSEVRQLWRRNEEEFRARGLKADPVAFAKAFADDNFGASL